MNFTAFDVLIKISKSYRPQNPTTHVSSSRLLTPSTTPSPLLICDDCQTSLLPVMHTHVSSSRTPLSDPYIPMVTTLMSLESTLLSPTTTTTLNHPPLDDLHLLITLKKGTNAFSQHLIAHYLSYEGLSPTYYTFVLDVSLSHYPLHIMKLSEY